MLLCAAPWAPTAHAFQYYDDGFGVGCGQTGCHTGFEQGPQSGLHVSHTGKFGISFGECNLCHPDGPGSEPVATYTSDNGAGLGCVGCHGRDYGEISPNSGQPKATGYGLRQVHVNAAVPGCPGCHQPGSQGHPDPLPPIMSEDVRPPYYEFLLKDPCSSLDEDFVVDADTVGLDNDGDGFADWPADLDCDEPTTTTTNTTTTTSTTTTLPVACEAAPVDGCVAPGKSVLLVNEKSAGKEKLKVLLKKLESVVTQSQFGDPVDGGTSYAICIYDELDQLSGEISIARAGDSCGSPSTPCFAAVSTKGFKYLDKLTTADGILKMVMTGGDPGKGKLVIVGKNNASASQTSLPTGIAPALQSNAFATVQLVTSDAACFAATVTQVKTADGVVFKANGP